MMMLKKIIYIPIFLGVVFTTSCEPEFENPIEDADTYDSGQADFSNYIALGNSLTAGFMDNALFVHGQKNSYPNILSKQFKFAGGGDFVQPLMQDNVGGFSNNPTSFPSRLVLSFDEKGSPVPANFTGASPVTDFTNTVGLVHNMGIPGAKSFHLGSAAAGYGNASAVASGLANPYFVRFASSASASVIDDAVSLKPTFFSLWIGNNDILSYATSGGTGTDQTGNPNITEYASNDITDPGVFKTILEELVSKLTATGAKGVLLNLPDIASLPFFTTVPFNPVPMDQNTATSTNLAFALYNGAIAQALSFGLITEAEAQKRTINFIAGSNPVVIIDENLTDLATINAQFASVKQYRQATKSDLIVLPASAFIGTLADPNDPTTVNGVGVPLDDKWVLTPEEQEAVSNARTKYNATIQSLASDNALAFYDAAADLALVAEGGLSFNGGVVTATFASGGGFSLDGVHPTPRGQAIVANGILKTLETTYNSKLPKVDLGDYGTITVSNNVK